MIRCTIFHFLGRERKGQSESQTERLLAFSHRYRWEIPHIHKMQLKLLLFFSCWACKKPETNYTIFFQDK